MSNELIEELTGIICESTEVKPVKISEGQIRRAFQKAFQEEFAVAKTESDEQIIAALASIPLYQVECIAMLESVLSKDEFAEIEECFEIGGTGLVEAWVGLRERPHTVRFLGEEQLDELLGIFKKKPPQRTGALSRSEKEALVKKRFGNPTSLGAPARKHLPQGGADPLAARQAANPGLSRTMSRGTSPGDKSKITVRKGGDFMQQHFGKGSPLPRKSQEKATHDFGMGQLGPAPKAKPAEVKTGLKAAGGVANKMSKPQSRPPMKPMGKPAPQSNEPGMMSKIAHHAGNIAQSAGKHLLHGAGAVAKGAAKAGGALAKGGVGMAHRALAYHMAKLRNKHPGLAHVFFGKLGHGSAEHDAHQIMGTAHHHLPGEEGPEHEEPKQLEPPKAAEPEKKPEGGGELHPELHHHIQRAIDAAFEKHGLKKPAAPAPAGAETPAVGREQHLKGQLDKHKAAEKVTGKKTRAQGDIEKELASKAG